MWGCAGRRGTRIRLFCSTCILSLLAAIQAPVIMMSQNRQDMKDRVRGELDYAVNRRSETEIQGLARKLNLLGDKMGDIEELLRGKKAS